MQFERRARERRRKNQRRKIAWNINPNTIDMGGNPTDAYGQAYLRLIDQMF